MLQLQLTAVQALRAFKRRPNSSVCGPAAPAAWSFMPYSYERRMDTYVHLMWPW